MRGVFTCDLPEHLISPLVITVQVLYMTYPVERFRRDFRNVGRGSLHEVSRCFLSLARGGEQYARPQKGFPLPVIRRVCFCAIHKGAGGFLFPSQLLQGKRSIIIDQGSLAVTSLFLYQLIVSLQCAPVISGSHVSRPEHQQRLLAECLPLTRLQVFVQLLHRSCIILRGIVTVSEPVKSFRNMVGPLESLDVSLQRTHRTLAISRFQLRDP